MDLATALAEVVADAPLSREDARLAMAGLVADETPDALIGGFLAALAARGSGVEAIVGFVQELRTRMFAIELGEDAVDTCGTGGGEPSPNISTLAALMVAGAGGKVAKHGNRAVTGKVGSSDVLEALGVPLSLSPEDKRRAFGSTGAAFLFAPDHHPALKRVGPVRRALGVRTVFNQLGPLLNPAGVRRQVTGVYSEALLGQTAAALAELGCERGVVTWNDQGFDEAMPFGTTHVRIVEAGQVSTGGWTASDFGTEPVGRGEVPVPSGAEEAAELARKALCEPDSVPARLCYPTAGAALWVGGWAGSVADGCSMARQSVASGKAWKVVEEIRKFGVDT